MTSRTTLRFKLEIDNKNIQLEMKYLAKEIPRDPEYLKRQSHPYKRAMRKPGQKPRALERTEMELVRQITDRKVIYQKGSQDIR